jgi:class 3 adenylate cyclase
MASDIDATRHLQRKLATILSGDVAGYARLMAEDEEHTLLIFRGHKQVFETLIAQHRGRVFNTAGDAILAEFASPVEAVRCATEIQAALRTRNDQLPPARRVEFRLGVNLGDVLVQGTDLLGDSVNLAARLQTAAEPGGVCISGSVYDQIQNKLSLSFRSLGEQSFKNIPQSVRTFLITEADERDAPASAVPRRIGGAWPWLAVAVVLLLAAGGGWWAWSQHQAAVALALQQEAAQRVAASLPAGGAEEAYAGQVCFGPAPDDVARCFHAQATLHGGRLLGQWTSGTSDGTMLVSGEVAPDGTVKIVMRSESADHTQKFIIDLAGTLHDGKLDATGSFRNGRAASLTWQRSGG